MHIIAEQPPMMATRGDVTLLLESLASGDRSAEEALIPRVYVELHRMAMARLRYERPGHTLQPTALVNEAYLRLCRIDEIKFENRAHFFRVAAQIMRRILVDHARQRCAQKRNSGAVLSGLEDVIAISPDQSAHALEIDQLLNKLAEVSPRQAQVVEMRFFGGLAEKEIASALGKNIRTIRRDWLMARAWLHEQLGHR